VGSAVPGVVGAAIVTGYAATMPAEARRDIAVVSFELGSPRLEDAARVHAAVFQEDQQSSVRFFAEQAGRPDFHGRLVLAKGTAVGMGFGARAQSGHWWYDGIAEKVGAAHPALQDAWNLAELALLVPFRRRGIGSRLVDTLLAAQPCPRVLLSVIVANTPARQFYEATGWQYVHSDLSFARRPPKRFAIMVRESQATDARRE